MARSHGEDLEEVGVELVENFSSSTLSFGNTWCIYRGVMKDPDSLASDVIRVVEESIRDSVNGRAMVWVC